MAIKYEVHQIENSAGSGKTRKYIQLRHQDALTVDEVAREIEEASTVSRADVLAVMAEMSRVARRELAAGRRFCLSEIGYLWLAVGNPPVGTGKDGKLTGRDIYVKNINFRPEKQFLSDVRRAASFEKSGHTSRSKRYDEDALWAQVADYLDRNRYLTCRWMKSEFKLSDYMARQWIARFVAAGKLTVEGSNHERMYFKA